MKLFLLVKLSSLLPITMIYLCFQWYSQGYTGVYAIYPLLDFLVIHFCLFVTLYARVYDRIVEYIK